MNHSINLNSGVWTEDRKGSLKRTSHNLEWQAIKMGQNPHTVKKKNDYTLHIFYISLNFHKSLIKKTICIQEFINVTPLHDLFVVMTNLKSYEITSPLNCLWTQIHKILPTPPLKALAPLKYFPKCANVFFFQFHKSVPFQTGN